MGEDYTRRRLEGRVMLIYRNELFEAHTNGGSLGDLWNEVSVGLDHMAKALRPLLPADLATRARVIS